MRKTIADLMSVDFVTVTARMPLEEALLLLLEADATELCVVDAHDRFEGIVTDYDLLKSHLNLNGQFAGQQVGSLISRAVTVLSADIVVEQVIPFFRDGNCSRAYVCRDGRLLGRLSRSNVLCHLAGREPVLSTRVGESFQDSHSMRDRAGRELVLNTPPTVQSVRTTLPIGQSTAIDTRETTPRAPQFMTTPVVSVLGSLCTERT